MMEMRRIFTLLLLGCMFWKILGLTAWAGEETYRVCQQESYVAVRNSAGELLGKTDTRVATLPPSDEKLLKGGLPCKDRESLQRALENFCS